MNATCETCKFYDKILTYFPCKECENAYVNQYQPMTNADRIRSMTSDSELAVILEGLANHSKEYIVKWLSQPIEDGD